MKEPRGKEAARDLYAFHNVRLVSARGEEGGRWIIPPGIAPERMAHIFRSEATYQREEPNAGWHLETRGEATGWHRWQR